MIVQLDKATKSECIEMIDYFLSVHCIEAAIKYTERLYEIVDFEAKYSKGD